MFEELERQAGERARTRENAARMAQVFAKYETTGQGTFEFADYADFGLTFIEEPFVAFGCQVDIDELAELMGLDPGATPPLPQVTGFVTGWDQDENDLYTGAWVAVTVSYPSVAPVGDPTGSDLQVHVYHHFTFSAIAMKAVPVES